MTMRSYKVFLESSSEGLCMAHAADLPGCIARGESREQALDRLPGAIGAYHAWLSRHGEPLAGSQWVSGEQVELEVVGESEGVGPFGPGDAAALFPPDREPVTLEEMEAYLRLSDYARSDLLALTRAVPEVLLEWQPYPDWFSIGQVLRHVGNAEEWYVSRLVSPETLPREWNNDADLPLFEFLEMERRTGIARLRQLTAAERGRVYTPTAWTRHPEEAWALRKVLRRFLEHELEHTGQVRRILDLYRRGLAAHLAAQQAALFEPLLGLDEKVLVEKRVLGEQTAKDLLAWFAAQSPGQLQAVDGSGGAGPVGPLALRDGDGGRNALEALEKAAVQGRELGEVLAELDRVQAAWLAGLAEVAEEALFRWGAQTGAGEVVAALSRRLQHDTSLLAAWAEGQASLEGGGASTAVLRAALLAGRRELLASCGAILGGEPAQPVCGTWTLQDVVGHVADWELFGAEGLRHMAEGRAPDVEAITDIDAWNEAHATARRGELWEQTWAALQQARRALLETLDDMDEGALACRFAFPWGGEGTPYQWLRVYLAHDREHAAGLRTALAMPTVYSSSYVGTDGGGV